MVASVVTNLVINGRFDGQRAFAAVETGLNKIGTQSKQTGGLLQTALGAVTKFVASPAAIVGGLTAAAGGFAAFTASTINMGRELDIVADRVGITASQMRLMTNVAVSVGEDIGTVEGLMETFADRVLEVAEGTGEGADVFAKLGISLRDTQGNIKPTQVLFEEYTRTVNSLSDGTEAVALNTRLLGTDGVRLIPAFKGIEGRLTETNKQFDAQAKASREVAKQWNEIRIGLTRTAQDAIGPLIPLVSDLLLWLREMTSELRSRLGPVWLRVTETFEQFRPTLEQIGRVAGAIIIPTFRTLGGVIADLAGAVLNNFVRSLNFIAPLIQGIGAGFADMLRLAGHFFLELQGHARQYVSIATNIIQLDFDSIETDIAAIREETALARDNLEASATNTIELDDALEDAKTPAGNLRTIMGETADSTSEAAKQVKTFTDALENISSDTTRVFLKTAFEEADEQSEGLYKRLTERATAAVKEERDARAEASAEYLKDLRLRQITGIVNEQELARLERALARRTARERQRLVAETWQLYTQLSAEAQIAVQSQFQSSSAFERSERERVLDAVVAATGDSFREINNVWRRATSEQQQELLKGYQDLINEAADEQDSRFGFVWDLQFVRAGNFYAVFRENARRLFNERLSQEEQVSQTALDGLNVYFQRRVENERFAQEVIEVERFNRANRAIEETRLVAEARVRNEREAAKKIREENATIVDSLRTGLAGAIEGLIKGTRSFGDALKSVRDGVLNQIIKIISGRLANALVNAVLGGRNAFSKLAGDLPGIFGGFFRFLGNSFTALLRGVGSTVGKLFGGSGLGSVGNAISSAVRGIGGAAAATGGAGLAVGNLGIGSGAAAIGAGGAGTAGAGAAGAGAGLGGIAAGLGLVAAPFVIGRLLNRGESGETRRNRQLIASANSGTIANEQVAEAILTYARQAKSTDLARRRRNIDTPGDERRYEEYVEQLNSLSVDEKIRRAIRGSSLYRDLDATGRATVTEFLRRNADQLQFGGIVPRTPGGRLSLIGEGRLNEAVVPLPNGRAIPVEIRGGSAGGTRPVNITVNVSRAEDARVSGTDGELSPEQEERLSEWARREQQPGGIFAT